MHRETEHFIYKKINDTDRPFFARFRRSAGGLVPCHNRHQSQTLQQPDQSNVMLGRKIPSIARNGGNGPLIMCLRAGLTRSLKRDCVCWYTRDSGTRASIRSEWSWVGSGSASSTTSSICGATVHNSRHLLSFIKWSLSPPRLSPASWTPVRVTAALSSSSDLKQIKTTVQWNGWFIKPVWTDSFTNLTFIKKSLEMQLDLSIFCLETLYFSVSCCMLQALNIVLTVIYA